MRPAPRRPRRGALPLVAAAAVILPLLAGEPASGAPRADDLDLGQARVQWIDRATVAWPKDLGGTDQPHRLSWDPEGELRLSEGRLTGDPATLELSRVEGGLTEEQRARYPHLAAQGYEAYRLDTADQERVPDALRAQLVATVGEDTLSAATGVQIPGVLDDLYAQRAQQARLGPRFEGDRTTLSVWAPTAREVSVDVGGDTVAMERDQDSGVWTAEGDWRGKSYRYRVRVWAPDAGGQDGPGQVVTNEVTDPYSTALTTDSRRSVAADLTDPALAPAGWADLEKPQATPLRDAQIQELHVRDFSVSDETASQRGRYGAFADPDSRGSKHLARLAASGTSHVHLLPAYDFGSVPEKEEDQQRPDCDLSALAPDSPEQQKCVTASAAEDAFNWGYDPVHYTVPEGSYASDPEGPARTREFRQMVAGLADNGLRTVMDVVYNHTYASGQDERSVLDRIVPGYYHRLLEDGTVADSTCCANTAPEHAMMGKLVVDSVVTWAREYKVDGFRFDLMGHHPKANILAVRKALDALTPEKDGVDGKGVLLYGEGWNFGEVADDARFEQATQKHMAGTDVATFSDRARDAIRGGAPFDEDPRVQGFGSGLFTDPNDSGANGSSEEQRARLLHYQDLVKVGLSGNLADYSFTDTQGRQVKGSEVDYGGSPAGYAARPGDALAYADAHDNETLFDALAFKLPADTSATDRARMQVLAMATATLSQGPTLSQAGTDLLRSKSLDRNSFDSGDWFNPLNWDCRQGNGFGRGLPPAADNEDKWTYGKPLLANPGPRSPGCEQIEGASGAYRDLLRIRTTEEAFGKNSADEVQKALSFPLSGTEETPGVVTMRLDGLTVVFNATPEERSQTVPQLAGSSQRLHPVQAEGADPTVRTARYREDSGTFTVPARTVAVFQAGS